MATTIEEYAVDGIVLNTYAFNIRTLSGRDAMPPLRGENSAIAFRPGKLHRRKQFDEKIETLSMWVVGCNEDGTFPTAHSKRAQYNANREKLKRIFGQRRSEITLSRKLALPAGLLTLTGSGEVTSTIDAATMAGATRGTFTVDMLMADPYWYGPEVEAVVSGGAPVDVEHPGSAIAQKVGLLFTGPLAYPRVTVAETSTQIRINAVLAPGETITVDTDNFTAIDDDDVNRIGVVSNAGSYFWLELDPGTNTVAVDNWQGGTLGAGTVTVTFNPPYL